MFEIFKNVTFIKGPMREGGGGGEVLPLSTPLKVVVKIRVADPGVLIESGSGMIID